MKNNILFGGESASADFQELRREFIPRRVMAKGKSND